MNTKFKTVAEAAANLAEDPQMEKRVKDEISRNTVISVLVEMRIDKGLTQEQVAQLMGCDPSVVSRIESGSDRQLKWTDIMGYCSALKVTMNILFDDPAVPAADRIKQYVFKIHEDLEHLAALAKEVGGEDDIAREIDRFYKQVLFNFLVRFKKNYDKLTAVVKIPARTPACPEPETKVSPSTASSELAGK
jgi:transcriptional regulator with XRE-family HTH domain